MAYSESQQDIISSIRSLEIPKKEMILVGGVALDLFNIRFSKTIDLVVSSDVMLELLDKADNKTFHAYSLGHIGTMAQVLAIGKGRDLQTHRGFVSFMPAPNDHLYQASFEQLRAEAIDTSDILVSPLGRLLDWKQKVGDSVGNQKDLADAELIGSHLSNNEQSFETLHQLISR